MVIFPLAPDQTIAQMWSNGARGGFIQTVVYESFVDTELCHALWRCGL